MPRSKRLLALVAALLAAVAAGAGAGVALYATRASGGTKTVLRPVTVQAAQPVSSTKALSVNEIYRRSHEGVVQITVASASQSPFGGSETQQAQGSGFVYDASGDIVTDQHVVAGASSISVKFWNGATYSARVVGTDASTDLAVLRVSAPASLLHPLVLADSSGVAVGDGVVAIGSPFGLAETVTSGIVSALHRQITSPNNFTIDDAIQTDAPINHGNSGGVLLDATGDVIGVTAQIESNSGGSEGVGFAIPSNTVKQVVGGLIANGKVSHAYLGVAITTIPSSVAGQLHESGGAAVTQVRSSAPAAQAGLRAATGSSRVGATSYPTGGDVITAVDGKSIASADQLQALVAAKRPGQKLTLTVSRGGSTRTVAVTLGTRPS